MDEIADVARRLENLEDDLAAQDGLEDVRERVTKIRMDLVDAGLEEAMSSARSFSGARPPERPRRELYLTSTQRTWAMVVFVVSSGVGGAAAVYASRFFGSWPAQLAGGVFLWVVFTLFIFLFVAAILHHYGVFDNEQVRR